MATARFLLFTPPWQHQSRANAGARLHPHRCGAPHSPQPLCAGSWTAGAANLAMANAIAAVGTYPGYQSGVTAMVLQGQMTAFVARGDGFEPLPVELGARSGGMVTVKSGLEAGDELVVEGAYALKARLLKSQIGDAH